MTDRPLATPVAGIAPTSANPASGVSRFGMPAWRGGSVRRTRHRLRSLVLPLLGTVLLGAGPVAAAEDWRPSSVVGAYLAGGHAQMTQDLPAAAAFLGEVLAADPDNVSLLRRTFTIGLAAGADEQATAWAAALLEADPDDPLARLALVMEAARDGEWALATERLSGMHAEGIERAIVPLIRSWLLVGQGDVDGAAAALDELAGIAGFEGLADIHRALLADVTGDLETAEATFERLGDLGHTVRLVQAYVSVAQRLGHAGEAAVLLADLHDRGVSHVLISEMAERLAAGEPVESPVTNAVEGLAEAMFYIASIANQDVGGGSGDVALIYARFALLLRPDFAAARMLVGDILNDAGQPAGALAAYDAVTDGGAIGWLARLRSTSALDRMDRFDEALDRLTDLIAERPDRPEAYVRMGDIYRVQEMFGPAVVAYDDAARRDPRLVEEDWTFLFRRAIVLERSDAFDRAEGDFRKAIELRPNEPHLLNYLGYSLLDRDMKIDEAEALIREAYAMAPDDGAIIDSLGWVYYKRGDLEVAVSTLEDAVARMPADPVLNDHLGDAYWRVGRQREARFQWERALREAGSDAALAAAIRAKLRDGLIEDPAPVRDGAGRLSQDSSGVDRTGRETVEEGGDQSSQAPVDPIPMPQDPVAD